MSQAPVQLVIIMEGGVVQDVMSCGIPIRAVIVDYDDDDDPNTVPVPFDDGTGSDPAYVWEILVTADQPARACELFNLGASLEPAT